MIKKLFKLNYNHKNLMMLIETALLSAMSINFIAPLISIYIMYKFINYMDLYIWFIIHICILFARIFLTRELRKNLQAESDKIYFYANILLLLTILTSLLYTYLVWFSVLNNIPELNIFMLSAVILTFTAGSISTLMSVFHIFAIFIIINMLSLVSALLYHGGDMFYVFAMLLSVFAVVFIKAGYRQYMLINNLISLKETFQTIYDKSSDSVALISNNKFKDCNPAALKMFELNKKEQLIGAHSLQFMPKYQDDGSLSVRKMMKMSKIAIKNGQHSFEWLYKKRDGSLFWTEVVLTKIYIDGEEIIHSVYRDITRRKELEIEKERFQETLKQQVDLEVEKNRAKDKALLQQGRLAQMGEMISMIAHQWRQPLSAISATSGSIAIKAKLNRLDKETNIELSNKITRYAQHLSSTIDDFRNFFKDDKIKSDTTLEKIVADTLDIVHLSLKYVNIKVVTDFKSNINISTYTNEIKQVLLNIIKNSEDVLIDKNIKNPQIDIKTYQNTIEISDNGGGIPEYIIDKIFDPSFSTKRKKDGTGLGLYMSKIIIEEHCGGKLSVKNNKNGASFTIDLPSIQGEIDV
jgi:PAS domain S-box-containing protein